MTTQPPAPDPATRLSEWDRKLLGLPKDPTVRRSTYVAPKTRLVWNRERLAVVFATSVLVVALTVWALLIATEGDTQGPVEGPTDTVYNSQTGQIVQEGTGIVLEETR